MANKTIPYFQIYAVDFIALTRKVSNDEIVEIFNSISDLCIYGKSDYKTDNIFAKTFYEKLLKDLDKNKKKYYSSVSNGKKGGRPCNNPQVSTGLTQTEPTGKATIIETEAIIETEKETEKKEEKIIKKEYGEFKNVLLTDPEYQKLFNIYFDKLDSAIEFLSSSIESKGYKYKSHYAVMGETKWVYKEIMNQVGGQFVTTPKKDTIESNREEIRKFLNKQGK